MTQETETQSAVWSKPRPDVVTLEERTSSLSREFTVKCFYDFTRQQMLEMKEVNASNHASIGTCEIVPFTNLIGNVDKITTSTEMTRFNNFQKAKNLLKNR